MIQNRNIQFESNRFLINIKRDIKDEMMNIAVFVIGHKPFELITNDPIYRKLIAGYEKNDGNKYDYNNTYIFDNIGDNISYKNDNFCELTGQYWIWKNVSDIDIVGICHYRRYFYILKCFFQSILTKKQRPLNDKQIDHILKNHDMIVKKDIYILRNVYEYFAKHHYQKDMDITRDVIKNIYPEYIESFDRVMSSHISSSCNMIVCNKLIFDKYSEWLFNILFELEKRIDISDYDNYQKRVFGFISERLLRVWVLKNNIKEKTCLAYKIQKI